jgi:hypothetical protein
MTMNKPLLLACLLLPAAVQAASPAPVTVSNFTSGLACTRSTAVEGRSGWICQPTDLVLMTDQGDCVYDGKKELCTWFGFEFDYVAGSAGRKLQCHTHDSRPADEGNYEGVRHENATDYDWELELPEASGHFYNPQYYVVGLRPAGDHDVVTHTTCSSAGQKVIEFGFRIRFPVDPSTERST